MILFDWFSSNCGWTFLILIAFFSIIGLAIGCMLNVKSKKIISPTEIQQYHEESKVSEDGNEPLTGKNFDVALNDGIMIRVNSGAKLVDGFYEI